MASRVWKYLHFFSMCFKLMQSFFLVGQSSLILTQCCRSVTTKRLDLGWFSGTWWVIKTIWLIIHTQRPVILHLSYFLKGCRLTSETITDKTWDCPSAGSMQGQRLWRWASIESTLVAGQSQITRQVSHIIFPYLSLSIMKTDDNLTSRQSHAPRTRRD